MKAVENYRKKNYENKNDKKKDYKKFEPYDIQQLLDCDLDDFKKILEINSNLKKQDKKYNHTDARNKNYSDKQQFNTQRSINFSDLEQFLKNRNDLKTLKKVEDLIEKKSQSGNPYINNLQGTKNNSKQFDKESSFDDEMCNLKLSQEDMFDISGISSSSDDISRNDENYNKLFDYVFNNPQDDRIDFSEFNKKGTDNITIEDNYDKTDGIKTIYLQSQQKIRNNESLTDQETDVMRYINELANIIDKNEYYYCPNTLYQDFSNNNNDKKKKQPGNANKNKNDRVKSLLDKINKNNAKKKKKKPFNVDNSKNNRKAMLSYSDDIRGKNAQNMKKKRFNANAQSWNDCYKQHPVSAALKNKQEWLDYYSSPMFSTKQKYNNLEKMKKNSLLNSKDIQEFKEKFNLK